MTDSIPSRLQAAAHMIGASQQTILKLIESQPEGWKKDIVAERRIMAGQLAEFGTAITEWSPPPEKKSGHDGVRARFSKLRSGIAEHQANWPAVTADPQNRAFRESNQHLKELYDEFHQAVRQITRGQL